ncbi:MULTISPECIES: PhoH family protein [unclassified Massilia]|uniref:PhoH family protein n=1 Tax=unclassified Massilia TaxID=2609279 RepID=UPI001B81413E|nr:MULTISPECIES: PhoH family protein [unclassified Massilia]MBQ5939196.1 PhoH family protein [Massilia sp. AB1]MBQ5964192.1 PhoH family protein [Massilia sp. ZL223]
MPLPKMPTKPATMLLAKDYPKAEPGKSPVRPASTQTDSELEELISGQAVPAPKTRPRKKAAPAPALAAVPAPERGETQRSAPATVAKLRETDADQPHPAKHKPVEVTVKSSTSRKADKSGITKVFVLDTNVLMHDPTSLFRFEEHDVYLPMMTLEELDNHKKGMSEVARNARQVSRTLDALIANVDDDAIEAGIPLAKLGNKDAKGRLYFQTRLGAAPLPEGLPSGKADNQILGVVRALEEEMAGRAIVLVSKDINMRIKARAMGLPAEDYFNDHVLEDTDLLYSGIVQLPEDFWDSHGKDIESWQENRNGYSSTFYRITGPVVPSLMVNQFVYLEPKDGDSPFYAQVKQINGKTAVLETLRDYSHNKNNVWGITARNREQNFALNLLMNPECDFVTLLGQAGTGKTLLALAAGLAQVLETKLYNEIIVTRVTVPVGEDIGFLPGTEEEKMSPWMGAFDDNLEVLMKSDGDAGDWGRAATQDLIRSRIKIKSLNFMRGRTFVNKFLIIDEAQNLTPKQMKTLVTRAGPGTKILCLGNIAQIDTPYLTEGSSGLTYVVDRFKGWGHSGHVTLARGERSRLADHASDVL